jgi:hypothetical protein
MEPQDLLELVYGAGKKPGFFHDAWNEYALVLPERQKFSLTMGGGLHYYMGLSRATMASTLNFLTIDAPIFNWPLIENLINCQTNGFICQRKIRETRIPIELQ